MDENSKTPTGSQAGSSSGSSLSDSNVSASAPAVGGPGDNLSTGSHAAAPVPTAANRGFAPAGRGEILAWAAYDIANATYGTVVATAIYNAYFVETICGTAKGFAATNGGFLLTLVIATSAAVIVLTAPVIGTIGDATAGKKKLLIASTVLCIFCTALLFFIGPGAYLWAMLALACANIFFGTGEDLIASFLPELTTQEHMGRVSALGWAAGYVGSLLSLGLCGAYVYWQKSLGRLPTEYVPTTMLICAFMFLTFSLPTFIFLKERAIPEPIEKKHRFDLQAYISVGFSRLKQTLSHARHYRDLFNFLLTMFIYSCGTTTMIHMASVYAQEVLKFTPKDSIVMILVVCVTAAIGAGVFGYVQDRIGSIKTLGITLSIWTIATVLASAAQDKSQLWIASNLVGIAMGATGSAGRALVAQFSPRGRSGEFLGLWGVAHKLATAVGALSFGFVTLLSGNNYRLAVLSCAAFFVVGALLLLLVNESRGKLAAQVDVDVPV